LLKIGRELVANLLPSRGEIAAQEQVRIFGQALVTEGEPYVPRSRGEVATQEQMRIVQEAMTYKITQPREPKTRGEVATQEHMRVFGQMAGNLST
jgi:hypothetical protein